MRRSSAASKPRTRSRGTALRCYSACALVWAAGVQRDMAPDARLGFHTSYVLDDGSARPSAIGNERVTAYLAFMGYDRAFAARVASTPPDRFWYPAPGEIVTSARAHRVAAVAD